MNKSVNHAGEAVVVWANWFQFGPGERIVQECVESRMLLWCQLGRGVIEVNGKDDKLTPGDWIFLPWRRHLVYEADPTDPFLVGGIHLIPHHRSDVPVRFSVDHSAGKMIPKRPERYDWTSPALKGVIQGHFEESDRLSLLATYAVEKFQSGKPQLPAMRMIAPLIVTELQSAAQMSRLRPRPMPGQMHRMQEYVRAHLAGNLGISNLARVAACSPMGVYRQFLTYAGMSPGRWIARLRARQASRLLRTTTLSVREVGEQIGLPDPFHFSRFFKRQMGSSPSAYRRTLFQASPPL
jgi:AraC-like DNA-binding protein